MFDSSTDYRKTAADRKYRSLAILLSQSINNYDTPPNVEKTARKRFYTDGATQ